MTQTITRTPAPATKKSAKAKALTVPQYIRDSEKFTSPGDVSQAVERAFFFWSPYNATIHLIPNPPSLSRHTLPPCHRCNCLDVRHSRTHRGTCLLAHMSPLAPHNGPLVGPFFRPHFLGHFVPKLPPGIATQNHAQTMPTSVRQLATAPKSDKNCHQYVFNLVEPLAPGCKQRAKPRQPA